MELSFLHGLTISYELPESGQPDDFPTMTDLTISDNGRVLIPAALREQLGLKPGTRVHAEVRDGSLVLTSASQRAVQRRAYFSRLMQELNVAPGHSLAGELITERRADNARDSH